MNNFIPFRISWKDVVVTMVVLGLFVSYYNFFNRDVDSVAYYCYFVTYCCFIVSGLFFIKKFFWFKKNGTRTTGIIIDVIDHRFRYEDARFEIVVIFKDDSGKENKVKSLTNFSRKKGDIIQVMYDPKNPKDAILSNSFPYLFFGVAFVLIGFSLIKI